ncbi:MAG: hypothetical protein DRQ55_03580 [Planctomycetota bacterium]|nr:MAG: hypothetical protein DRQ55_03580 [Planctomycetota bacterium]
MSARCGTLARSALALALLAACGPAPAPGRDEATAGAGSPGEAVGAEALVAGEPAFGPEPGAPEPPLDEQDLALVIASERALVSGQPEAVEGLLAPLLARERPPAKALFDAAWADYQLQRYGECVARMQRALSYDPSLRASARVLGFSHYKLGAYDAARQAFVFIVEARPDDHRAWYGLGQVELTLGRLAQARPAIERALALSPDYLKARHALARLAHAEGDDQAALEAAQWVLARQPSHDEALYLLSQVLASLGDEQRSSEVAQRWREVYAARDRVGVLQRRVAEGEDAPELFLAMAQEFMLMGDLGEARRVLRAGLARHPADAALQRQLLPLLDASAPGDDGTTR